jgi:hypothetical protein
MKTTHRIFALLSLCIAMVLSLITPRQARAVDYTVAGSTQLDYHYVPFNPANGTDPRPRSHTIDGLTEELSIKLAIDFSTHVSGNVKMCWGCHGFELGMAFIDVRLADEFNIRAGRFNPSFGEFQLRHDPGNHRTSDKPLPYDMGRMLYLYPMNRSVLPVPYVDNAIEISGSHFFGQHVQLDYAAHIATGLRALSSGAADVDFISMHAPTFMVMHGAYDPRGLFTYTIIGGDTFLRIGRVNIRGEYIIRRTEMDTGQDPTRWQYQLPLLANRTDFTDTLSMLKDGWYVEVDGPVNRRVELVARWDGIRRIGNVPLGTPLDFYSGLMRGTIGANFIVARGYRIKTSVEYWRTWGIRQTNDAPAPANNASFHVSLVATF